MRVLLVNDLQTVTELLAAQLRELGMHDLTFASDGSEALEVLERESFEVVLSDVHMPVLDGFQLCRLMRSAEFPQLNRVPVVLASATYRDSAAFRLAREVGAQAFLHWPFTVEDLGEAIRQAVAHPEGLPVDAIRVLVADDEQAIRNALTIVLRRAGFEVIAVADGRMAIEAGDAFRPHLVLCDYMMPKVDGAQVLAWYRAHRPDTPVIILTAHGSERLAVEMMRHGAYDYLTKPLDVRALPDLCQSALAKYNIKGISRQFEEILISARLAAEDWLRTFDAVVDAVCVLDSTGRVVRINRAWGKRLVVKPETLVGKGIRELLYGEDAAPGNDPIEAARTAGEPRSAELPLPGLGNGIWQMTASPLFGANGAYRGAALVARDVTAERRAQEQLLLSEKMATLGRMAAGITQEINDPASFVLLNLVRQQELLGEIVTLVGELAASRAEAVGGSPGSTALWASERAATEALGEARSITRESLEGMRRIREITQDLRLFSHLRDEEARPFDLNTVVESAIGICRHEVRHRARMVTQFERLPPCTGDPTRVGQVIVNLLVNAAQSMEEGRAAENEIRIRTYREEGRACLEIDDTGRGIPAELLPHVFDPFFVAKATGQGAGLGLSLCYEIVKRHGGEIRVASRAGVGSTFTVCLPAAAPVAEVPPKAEAGPGTPARILVIEDEIHFHRALRRVLREHELHFAQSGREALEILARDQSWDVVLSDIIIPDLSVTELYERVRRDWPELKERLVFLSGGGQAPSTEILLRDSGCPVLEKPVETATLRRVITEVRRK
jgi:PAS domain S-box-containing protein